MPLQSEVNLRDIFRVLRKWRWTVILGPILTAAATFVLSEVPSPLYDAEVLLRVSRTSTLSSLMTEIISYGEYDNMATQIMVVTSRPVLEEVAFRLNMASGDGDTTEAAATLKAQVMAEQRSISDIMAVMATAGSADEAMILANTTAEVYIDQYAAERGERVDEMVRFVEAGLAEAMNELEDAEALEVRFRFENAAILSWVPTTAYSFQAREEALRYRQVLADVETARALLTPIAADRDYERLVETFVHVDEPGTLAQVEDLRAQSNSLAELRAERSELLRFQLETAPEVQDLERRAQTTERRLTTQLTSLLERLDRLELEYQQIYSLMLAQEKDLLRQPAIRSDLENLQTLTTGRRVIAASLRGQLQDLQLQQSEHIDEVRVVERARTAAALPQQGRLYKTLVGGLIGLLLGGMFAFLLESMDTSIASIGEVEEYTGAPVVGVIPHLDIEGVQDLLEADGSAEDHSREHKGRLAALTTHFDSKSPASEAYRTLRTNLQSAMDSERQVLLVTSSVQQEGKTTTCLNLAIAYAQSGTKTLLIDADLRRPTIDKVFAISKTPGLTEVLLGTEEIGECTRTIDDLIVGRFGLKFAQWKPGLEYLHILPTGARVDNPTELLQSSWFAEVLANARKDFEMIIIDVAPVLPVADAYVLVPLVDGILLTYQIGHVAREVLRRTKDRVESLGGTVVGIVMNDTRSEIDYRRGDFRYYPYEEGASTAASGGFGERLRKWVSGVLPRRQA